MYHSTQGITSLPSAQQCGDLSCVDGFRTIIKGRAEQDILHLAGKLGLDSSQEKILFQALADCYQIYAGEKRKGDILASPRSVHKEPIFAPTDSHHLLVMYCYLWFSDFLQQNSHGTSLLPEQYLKYMGGTTRIRDKIFSLFSQGCFNVRGGIYDHEGLSIDTLFKEGLLYKESSEQLLHSLLVMMLHDCIEDMKLITNLDVTKKELYANKLSSSDTFEFTTPSGVAGIPSFGERISMTMEQDANNPYLLSTLSMYAYLVETLQVGVYHAFLIVRDIWLLSKIQLHGAKEKISNEAYYARLKKFPHLRLKKISDHCCNSLGIESIERGFTKKELGGKVMNQLYEILLPVFTSFLDNIHERSILHLSDEYIQQFKEELKKVLWFGSKYDMNLFISLLSRLKNKYDSVID